MNKVLQDIINDNIINYNGKLTKIHSHIEFDQGFFLKRLIKEIKAEKSLEVGLAYGISTLFICDSLVKTDKTCHIVMDPYQYTDWEGIGIYNLKMAGYEDIIEFYNLPSHIALPQLEVQKRSIDFAFIDGNHLYDYAMIDFFYIDRLLRVGGIIVLDDVNMKSIKKLCRYIITNRAYTLLDYWGSLKGFTPKKNIYKIIKMIMTPFINAKRLEYFVKFGVFHGVRCFAFRKLAEDHRHWTFHCNF